MYSPEARVRMRRSIFRAFRFGIIWFGIFGGIIAFLAWKIASGESDDVQVIFASIGTGVFLLSLWVARHRMSELFDVPPCLHPYFDAKVPGCSLGNGVEILKQSGTLDSLAMEAGVKRIGEFVSDDDMFDNAGPTWHPADDGVITFSVLLTRFNSHPSVKAAEGELKSILERLLFARANGIQFCLLFRNVHGTNQMEWDARKGYC